MAALWAMWTLSLGPVAVHAATLVWCGSAAGEWSDRFSWRDSLCTGPSPPALPGAADTVVLSGPLTLVLDVAASVGGVQLQNDVLLTPAADLGLNIGADGLTVLSGNNSVDIG